MGDSAICMRFTFAIVAIVMHEDTFRPANAFGKERFCIKMKKGKINKMMKIIVIRDFKGDT